MKQSVIPAKAGIQSATHAGDDVLVAHTSVIPAKAGIQVCHREGAKDAKRNIASTPVIPAKAGVHVPFPPSIKWIPAFAGMTAVRIAGITGALLLTACSSPPPDAYGNFEAEEVVVSAEVAGQLVAFAVAEGETLAPGTMVGQIDVTTLELQREELQSQRGGTEARTSEAEAQIGVLQAQLATAVEEYARTRRLYAAEAATAQQLNQAEGAVTVLRARIEAARATTAAATQETGGVEARIAQLEDEIGKSSIVNPVAGTVLTRYVEAGELVQPGQPLYEIADLDPLTLRAYVSGAQLSSIRIGQPVEVRVDSGDGRLIAMSGAITSIASEAEFTPTPIQTREERTVQVYAVKIRVANPNGVAKIGMPAEVVLGGAEE